MRDRAFKAVVALAVLAVAACNSNPAGPGRVSDLRGVEVTGSTGSGGTGSGAGTAIKVGDLQGTWRAVKAEGWNAKDPNSRRDLVAEKATVTLVLEDSTQPGDPLSMMTYAVTVAMPAVLPAVSKGKWHYHEFWGPPQIDFYSEALLSKGPDLEYGEIPSFLVALDGDTLKLWDSGMTFLPFDFGWNAWNTSLVLVFTRE